MFTLQDGRNRNNRQKKNKIKLIVFGNKVLNKIIIFISHLVIVIIYIYIKKLFFTYIIIKLLYLQKK